MKRILWMVLMNLWYVPYGIIRLFRMAAHPERYSLEAVSYTHLTLPTILRV